MRSTAMVIAGLAAMLTFGVGTAEAQGKGNKGGKAKHAKQASQGKQSKHAKKVPPGHLPPAGSCRVWYDGVPPGHQPPPTSCGEAERVAARDGARVIYSDGRDRRNGSIWQQGGGGGDTGDIRRRDDDRDRRGDDRDRDTDRAGSRDRGNRPATGRAIPRPGSTTSGGGGRTSGDQRRPTGTIWPF